MLAKKPQSKKDPGPPKRTGRTALAKVTVAKPKIVKPKIAKPPVAKPAPVAMGVEALKGKAAPKSKEMTPVERFTSDFLAINKRPATIEEIEVFKFVNQHHREPTAEEMATFKQSRRSSKKGLGKDGETAIDAIDLELAARLGKPGPAPKKPEAKPAPKLEAKPKPEPKETPEQKAKREAALLKAEKDRAKERLDREARMKRRGKVIPLRKKPADWNPEEHWHHTLTPADRKILASIAEEQRLAEMRFSHVAKKHERFFLLTGPAGWGKSHIAKRVFDRLGQPYIEINSRMTAYEFYRLCFKYRHGDVVMLLDDAEDIIYDRHGVDQAKQAAQRGRDRVRRMTWLTGSAPMCDLNPADLTDEEWDRYADPETGKIPKRAQVRWFDFSGYIAMIVNADVRKVADTNKRLRLPSLLDCVVYQDIRLRSARERMLRVAAVVANEGMLYALGIDIATEKMVMEFIWNHHEEFYNLTLRSLEKVANAIVLEPDDWEVLCRSEFDRPLEEPERAKVPLEADGKPPRQQRSGKRKRSRKRTRRAA